MKKYLSILAVVAVAASAFAQGTINFANNGTTLVMVDPGAGGTPFAAPVGGYVQLLWAPAGTAGAGGTTVPDIASWFAANQGWAAVSAANGGVDTIGPVAGRFTGNTVTVPTATPGAPIEAIVAGWQGAATDVSQAANIGLSTRFAVDTGNPLATPTAEFAASITGAGQFTGMTIPGGPIIPEPSTLALAGLGVAALLVLRRRS